ncbi:radical SAM protein [Clostridium sp.]|uniref:radical SAM protein n=1 Tax=Clostridium sp. TaxID=1506 RepID=UPI001DEC661E|nr:radical SAM protein [Clostridium sp.]MBS5937512.1 radical SAM protein [Clostridium sp.]
MHYNGPIVRPPTDAFSVMLEVTVGCTHNSCTFCNFYEGYPFRMASLEQIEMDLQEVSSNNRLVKNVWAAGGNPYALSVEKLEKIALLVRKYLPKAKISTYARVDDFKRKSVEDIRHLMDLGFEDILIGVESADDEALAYMNKGYTGKDVLEQLKKVEASGVSYRVIYLGGIAGAGKCEESAKKTAKVLNELNPYMMFITSVAVLPGTELYNEVKMGKFIEASELERIKEIRTLASNLKNDIFIYARSVSSSVDFTASFPEDKERIIGKLDEIIDQFTQEDEDLLRNRRERLRTV